MTRELTFLLVPDTFVKQIVDSSVFCV